MSNFDEEMRFDGLDWLNFAKMHHSDRVTQFWRENTTISWINKILKEVVFTYP